MQALGFLGGTFDPIHRAHLVLALEALKQLQLQAVHLLLAPDPWQKTGVSPWARRWQWLSEAVAPYDGLIADAFERDLPQPTYTIDTLKALRAHYGPEVPFVWIMGADQWQHFSSWRDHALIWEYTHIAVANRGHEPIQADKAYTHKTALTPQEAKRLTQKPNGELLYFTIPPLTLSSSAIRRLDPTISELTVATYLEKDL